MLPIQFLFLTVYPVIDMRLECKSKGKDYPPQVHRDITKVLELSIVSPQICLYSILKMTKINGSEF